MNNEEIKVLIGLVFSVILIILNTRRYYSGKTRKQLLLKTAKAKGNVASADAIKNTYSYGDRRIKKANGHFASQTVKYEYIVNGQKYYFKNKYTGRDQTHCDFPLTLNVYYDENNPRRIAFDDDISPQAKLRGSLLSGVVIFFVVTIVVKELLNFIF